MLKRILPVLALCFVWSCHSDDHVQEHANVVKQLSKEALNRLRAADLADGVEDHRVQKCASCSLLMEGKAEFAMDVADTHMLFCSQNCLTSYSVDPGARLEALKLPEPQQSAE